jgi:spoIIIJ-associated protein
MVKGKDFYGNEVTAVIEDACRAFDVPQEELNIEVLETGSAGIFGLCKKKAHIRVVKKQSGADSRKEKQEQKKEETVSPEKEEKTVAVPEKEETKTVVQAKEKQEQPVNNKKTVVEEKGKEKKKEQAADKEGAETRKGKPVSPDPVETLTEEIFTQINEEICHLLELMGYPSQVALTVEGATLNCHLSGDYEEVLIGSDGRTLDSLQYLLRKMISRRLPDRMMLALDAGDFRERRAEELKERARQLAEEVKETGKTQAIPALNPAERRVVHMILQEDKAIRSRSVGEGLFKKVLIYKPGKGNKSTSKKRRGRQGGRTSEK